MPILSQSTQIPTSLRGTIRAHVKAHPQWPAFLARKGIISADARNADLIEFALQHPALTAEVEALLGLSPVTTPRADVVADDVVADAVADTAADDVVADVVADAARTFESASILSGVDQFLSPLVRTEIEKALAPVIAAANKPAVEVERVVEVERIVEVSADDATAPRVVRAKARRERKTTFRTLYPSRARDQWRDAQLTLWTGVAAPAVDPHYVTTHNQMALLMTAIERGTNVWLGGPAGGGKTTMPEQAAAMLGRPFVKLGMTRQTDVDSLLGNVGMKNGTTYWVDGPLIQAMRAPGTVILIDEITIAPHGVQAVFHQACDEHRSITLPTGEVVRAADGVVFVAADNTMSSGDETGLYLGTSVTNAALASRFKRMIKIDYLTPAAEADALVNHTKVAPQAARHLTDFVAHARALPDMAGAVISLRQLVGFIQCVQDGFTTKDAFSVAISSRMPATERATIEALATLQWAQAFDALVAGKPVPAAPSDSAAAQAFAADKI